MGDGNRQCTSRPQHGPKKAVSAGGRVRRAPTMASNVIALPSVDRSSQASLPKDHNAQIVLFTGVQIVRNGTQG